jgi:predicted RNase H-like HicB family nuclease
MAGWCARRTASRVQAVIDLLAVNDNYIMSILRRLLPRKKFAVTIQVSICVEKDERGFHAFNPALKGLHADGLSEEEAIREFLAAVPAYIESLLKHGDPLPLGMVTVQEHKHDDAPDVPVGAFLRHVQLSWPTHQISGIS